jgi:hypothetical protein
VNDTQCTFGADPVCRSLWLCWEEQWSRLQAGRDCQSETVCPDQPPRTGEFCAQQDFTPLGEVCIYPGAEICSCGCLLEPGSVDPIRAWQCKVHYASQPADYLRACPLDVPTIGEYCEFDGGSCVYNLTDQCHADRSGQIQVQCQNHLWVDITPETWGQP